ncbi:hypothetical protein N5923_09795 [Erwiniaceae bacterium BAC15a-03b]|uniref:TIGR02646 family protein n=1 Tax=Winslowiella arboricola TaxID=2978220 RepID=A0A9J6PQ90_9GAMM|nr:hypothetical protein [Winslowiella arboricola]MCU5773874.1 hypothetical protein [Winslowiella arboricola]MCU5777784.1 hypothetical protein [Winslowiella arboricola]
MIKMNRSAYPACLEARGQEWTERYVAARRKNPAAKFSWYSQSCYRATRDALLVLTQEHCAFCDGFVGNEGRKTLEHFRPKSAFPELAFSWENLFPCCDVCQSAKGEKYTELLLKPDESSYRFEHYFICNFADGALHPSPELSPYEQQRVEKTLELYGLNLPSRKVARRRELQKFLAVRDEMHIDEFPYRYFLMI